MAAAGGEGTAAAAGADSDGGSEELVLTPAQLIRSLEQVAWAGGSGWGPGPGAPRGGRGRESRLGPGLSGGDVGRLGAGPLRSPAGWGEEWG